MTVVLPLAHVPITDSVHVYVNGTKQRPAIDWTYLSSPPRISMATGICKSGDRLEARYAYTDSTGYATSHSVSDTVNLTPPGGSCAPPSNGQYLAPQQPDSQFAYVLSGMGTGVATVEMDYTYDGTTYFSDFGYDIYYKQLSTGCIFYLGGSGVSYSTSSLPAVGTVRQMGPNTWTAPAGCVFVCLTGSASNDAGAGGKPAQSLRLVAIYGDFS